MRWIDAWMVWLSIRLLLMLEQHASHHAHNQCRNKWLCGTVWLAHSCIVLIAHLSSWFSLPTWFSRKPTKVVCTVRLWLAPAYPVRFHGSIGIRIWIPQLRVQHSACCTTMILLSFDVCFLLTSSPHTSDFRKCFPHPPVCWEIPEHVSLNLALSGWHGLRSM